MELIAEMTTIESTQATTAQARSKTTVEAPQASAESVKELSSLQLALIGGGSVAISIY